MSSLYRRFHIQLPADAVTIPVSARGAFHPPPAAEKIADIRLAAAMR